MYLMPLGGGGELPVLSLEKGTNCGPTPQELWLSQALRSKTRGAVKSLYRPRGELFKDRQQLSGQNLQWACTSLIQALILNVS